MDIDDIEGTGGIPTRVGHDPEEARDAAADPDVAALVDELREDDGDVRLEPEEASEHIGTGTDR